ncbi:hypothetical protein G7Y89_g6122 [Cudoniella acicularis]|uniref:NAD(P)-binding protein n=1 Tax=Cudoniella acicularis TaxID=354080 RepID=A0A8H4RNI2_9HELO|nr:hypothetical protein G7Y89_g6122 [Cudoniella acicularis]
MPLTILSDTDVKNLLNNLTRADVESLQHSLRQALHEYSTGTQDDGCCSDNQPERTVLESHRGNTTLFMPSTSSSGIGMKVVTLATPPSDTHSNNATDTLDAPPPAPTTPYGALTLMDLSGKPFGFLNAEEVTAFRTALASSLLLTRRAKVKTITVFGVGKQAYWHVRLALLLHGSTIKQVHFINRTFSDRAKGILKTFVHIDPEIKTSEGWSNTTFGILTPGYGEYARLLKDQIRASDVIITTTPSTEPLFDHTILTNTEGRKRGRLIIAIGSYKKHMVEVPPEILSQATKRHGPGHHFHKHAEEGGVIVVDTLTCVTQTGELTQANIRETQTVELGELVMLERLDSNNDTDSAISDSPPPELAISLETLNLGDGNRALSHVFHNSINSNPPSPRLPLTLSPSSSSFTQTTTNTSGGSNKSPSRKSSFSLSRKNSFSFHKRSSSLSGGNGSRSNSVKPTKRKKQQTEQEDQMCRWLSRGNVVYKSVGMGLMDLVVGGDLVRLARVRDVGIVVEDF